MTLNNIKYRQMPDQHGLKVSKPINYRYVPINLAVARTDVALGVPGDFILVVSISGTLSVRLNNQSQDSISLNTTRRVSTPFTDIFLTNTAQPVATAVLLIGGDANFEAESLLNDTVLNTPSGVQVEPVRVATAYKYQSFDLGSARTNSDISATMGIGASTPGLGFTVVAMDATATATLRLGATTDDAIDIEDSLTLDNQKFTALFLTNAAQVGKTLKLFVPR